MPDVFVESVSERYIELFELLTGRKFNRIDTQDILRRIEANVLLYLTRA
jgi:phosphoribosylaminoimidazole-succinocarboxamide synthase